MYCLLFYELIPEYLERRGDFRAVHLGMAKSYEQAGKLLLAGALAEPADGAVLVFKGESARADAIAFAEADPYVQNGLVSKWYVRDWTVVVGGN